MRQRVIVHFMPSKDHKLPISAFFQQKKPQKFRINPKVENVLRGAEGTNIYLPANAFNRTYSIGPDSVDMYLTEYTTIGDMVMAGFNTMSQDGLLESGGSIKLEGIDLKNGKALVLGKGYGIAFKGREAGDRMDTWYGIPSFDNLPSIAPLKEDTDDIVPAKNMVSNFAITWERRFKEYNYIFRETGVYGNNELMKMCKKVCRERMDANKESVTILSSSQIDPLAFQKASMSDVIFDVEGDRFSAITQRELQYSIKNVDGLKEQILITATAMGYVNCDRLASVARKFVQLKVDGADVKDYYALLVTKVNSIIPCSSYLDDVYVNQYPVGAKTYLLHIVGNDPANLDIELLAVEQSGKNLVITSKISDENEVLRTLKSL